MLTFQIFAAPLPCLGDVFGLEDNSTFSYLHDYFLPPTTTCCLPRLPATSHDYLLPPTTTCYLPRLPAASHDCLLPPTTTCCLPRLPAASHDYLLPRHNKEKHPLILSTLL